MKLLYSIMKETSHSDQSRRGRALAKLLFDEYSIDGDIEIYENGKPYIKGRSDVDFNITHSAEFVGCVLSVGEGRVGIDAERIEGAVPKERQGAFIKRFFSPAEQKAIQEGKYSFSELWTRKEAYLKMLGIGISAKLADIDTLSLPVRFYMFCLEGYTVSVCTEREAEIIVEKRLLR